MSGEEQWKGSEHYLSMVVQPFDVFASMHMLWEYLITASIKYMMRAPSRDTREQCLQDLRKARHCIDKAIEVHLETM